MRTILAITIALTYNLGAAHAQEVARPHALVPLYAAFAISEALDVHSTHRALSSGVGREAGALGRCSSSVPCLIGVKAAITTGAIWAIDAGVRRRAPRAAVWLMVGLLGVQTSIDVHNYRVGRR